MNGICNNTYYFGLKINMILCLGMIYDQLVDFGNQCVVEEAQEESESHKDGSGEPRRPPLLRQSSVVMSPAKTSTPDSRTKIKRHPLTGKGKAKSSID